MHQNNAQPFGLRSRTGGRTPGGSGVSGAGDAQLYCCDSSCLICLQLERPVALLLEILTASHKTNILPKVGIASCVLITRTRKLYCPFTSMIPPCWASSTFIGKRLHAPFQCGCNLSHIGQNA